MSEKPLILVVDDTDDARYALEKLLKHNGYETIGTGSGDEALALARSRAPKLVLLDVMMPVMDGYEVAKRFKADSELRFIPIMLVTARDSLEDVVRGLDAGGDDYIAKPFKTEELLARVRAALRLQELYDELRVTTEKNSSLVALVSQNYDFHNIIGESAPMKRIFSLLERVAQAESPVLITGPSGTGKELVARAIHFNSPRKSEAFIARNCAAFNENLLESELFGHMRGSFTGAVKDQKGVFELADKGSLFLDEVGEMTPAMQAKLLRVLQEGTIIPVGASQERKVRVRVIAATHRNLTEMIDQGKFREDLYYRMNVVGLELPPLRDRPGDIPLLVNHFLERASKRAGGPKRRFSREAMAALESYTWRGNIRELENEVERALILDGDNEVLDLGALSERITRPGRSTGSTGGSSSPAGSANSGVAAINLSNSPPASGGNLKEIIEKVEREEIEKALSKLHWNRSKAAKTLGISRSNLLAKIESYGLKPPPELQSEEQE